MGLRLGVTTAADLDFVLALESDRDASSFVIRWSREQHERALTDAEQAHLLVINDAFGPVGFVILAGLASEQRNVELRRVVIAPKGRGVGREALSLVLDRAFGTLGAHRVWLDVTVDNQRAQTAFAAAGFVFEGVLREALLTNGIYGSLVVMSVLHQEWVERQDRIA